MNNTTHLCSETRLLANVRDWRRRNSEFLNHSHRKAKPAPVVPPAETDAAVIAKYAAKPLTQGLPL